ncbi:hypothetical protein T11_14756 [Trichinella zimbabwensis]|uniref:CCHC-type domain-containing protein n=1 Tax=Trichinella zimbabwensis TaxID=268475 RepID=A0A0V1GTG9_9BILA|nr:hypothetical protein T11_14756 [Trichinella zimbabwensis]
MELTMAMNLSAFQMHFMEYGYEIRARSKATLRMLFAGKFTINEGIAWAQQLLKEEFTTDNGQSRHLEFYVDNVAKVFGDEALRQKCFDRATAETDLEFLLRYLKEQSSDIAKKLFNAKNNRIEERRNTSLCGLFCYLDNPSNYVSSSSSNCILTRLNKRDIKTTAKDLFDRMFKIQVEETEDIDGNGFLYELQSLEQLAAKASSSANASQSNVHPDDVDATPVATSATYKSFHNCMTVWSSAAGDMSKSDSRTPLWTTNEEFKPMLKIRYHSFWLQHQIANLYPAPASATNGEHGRIDSPEWIKPPEVLTMVFNVETWFEHMKMYFRAARIAPERRAALVQYHTDADVRSIMRAMDVQETDDYDGLKSALFDAFGVRTGSERFSAEFFGRKQQQGESMRVFAGHLRRLFSKAFPEMSGSADKILLQQFKAGLIAEAIEFAAKEERVVTEFTTLKASVASVKTDAHQEDEQPAAAVTTRKEVGEDLSEVVRQIKELLTANTPAATKRSLPQRRRRPDKRGNRRCWTCGGLGHISRECQASSRDEHASKASTTDRTFPVVVIRSPEIETPIVKGSVGGVRCDMLVDTGSAVTLTDERFMRDSKILRDVPKPAIQLETASETELEITNACVTEIAFGRSVTVRHTVLCVKELSHTILLGWDFMRYHGCTPDPTAGCLKMRQGNIPFRKSHAVAPEAMEKMLPSEQESSDKHRSALPAILREFADVLSTSDEDLGRTSVVRHVIHTGDAKPVRCSPRRIPYHQRAQVEALLDEMLQRDIVEH